MPLPIGRVARNKSFASAMPVASEPSQRSKLQRMAPKRNRARIKGCVKREATYLCAKIGVTGAAYSISFNDGDRVSGGQEIAQQGARCLAGPEYQVLEMTHDWVSGMVVVTISNGRR